MWGGGKWDKIESQIRVPIITGQPLLNVIVFLGMRSSNGRLPFLVGGGIMWTDVHVFAHRQEGALLCNVCYALGLYQESNYVMKPR